MTLQTVAFLRHRTLDGLPPAFGPASLDCSVFGSFGGSR
jgi:hypothetical protein